MFEEINQVLPIMLALLVSDVVIIIFLLISKKLYKARHIRKEKLSQDIRNTLLKTDFSAEPKKDLFRRPMLLFELLTDLGDSVHLPEELQRKLVHLLSSEGYVKKIFSQLSAPSKVKRLRSVMHLTILGRESVGEQLHQRLSMEPLWFIRLAIIHSLARIGFEPAVADIMTMLFVAPHWVRQKSISVLPQFGEALEKHIMKIVREPEMMDEDLLFQLALVYRTPVLEQFLLDRLESGHESHMRRAAGVLEKTTPHILVERKLFTHSDPQVKDCALRSLPSEPTPDTIDILMEELKHQRGHSDTAVSAIQRILLMKPVLLDYVLDIFSRCSDRKQQFQCARVLEIRLEYLLSLINTAQYHEIRLFIETLLEGKRTAVLFGYLERRGNREIIESVLPILREAAQKDDALRELCSLYLPDHIAEELGIEKLIVESKAEKAPLKKTDRGILVISLFLVLFSGPALYLVTQGHSLTGIPPLEHVRAYAYTYNFFFAFYSVAINSIYLLLLITALFFLIKQLHYWRIHSLRFLFSPHLLPSISILAPAFNEEANIVNNVKSLLNLHYPDVEVIVINDGSKDNTLDKLIKHFNLERSDKLFQAMIPTEPIRGVYTSISFPNLTVVDKSNGGKADSLNAGINLAAKDFICTIDSDSLLEPDALQKIAFQSLLTDREPVAMGGNILPANGCEIRNGRITRIHLGKNHLVRFQTIEYMRSFLAGRLGWSFFNSMVIISGAFGLFLRRRVVEIGGYLTPKSSMHTSTVGEDMELVVRLHRHLRRKKVPYKVFDAFNANCWTEVPENFKILHRQRDRWHRGLIESVLLHKRMILNPRFGPVGLIAFPYFFLFELIGPFLELYGYINLFISLSLGLVDGYIALILFVAVIMYGMLISIGSLIISENEILLFNTRETFLIILYSILENFGFRQLMSMIRVTAYISFIFKEKSWGVMERKGLGGDQAPAKEPV